MNWTLLLQFNKIIDQRSYCLSVPPSPPVIYDDHDIPLSSLVGPFHLGSNLSLKCISRGGHPLPILVWTRDGLTLNTSYQVRHSDQWPLTMGLLTQVMTHKTRLQSTVSVLRLQNLMRWADCDWIKQSDLCKLLKWCQLLTMVCAGLMTEPCTSVWPIARPATSPWSSKSLWMSSVSIVWFNFKKQILESSRYVLLVYLHCFSFHTHAHTVPLFLCLHLLFSECLRMSENVGLKT